MRALPEPIHEQILRHGLLKRGQQLLVAVSGGLDSMVLLHALAHLSAEMGWGLTVGHVNHGLRGRSSDADERLIKKVAQKLRLPVFSKRVPTRQRMQARQVSLEMAARDLRHEFLVRSARQRGIRTIVLAHHADDQVELFFLRLLRGAGTDGLGGMKTRSRSPLDGRIELVRPLLETPKSSLRDYAERYRVKYREDASNESLEFQRNRVRHELLPLLEKNYQPAIGVVVRRLMDLVAAEADFASSKAQTWLTERSGGARTPRLQRPGFDELPVALQRRCLQLQLRALDVPVTFEFVESLRTEPDRLLAAPAAAGKPARSLVRDAQGVIRVATPARLKFSQQGRQLELNRTTGAAAFAHLRVRWAKRPDSGAGLERSGPKSAWHRESFDFDQVGSTIRLRYWQPGDRFCPIGMASAVKLQDLFVNQKIPRARRHEMVVATTAGEKIFWVEGLRIGEDFKLTSATRKRLVWEWRREK